MGKLFIVPKFVEVNGQTGSIIVEVKGKQYSAFADMKGNIECSPLEDAARIADAELDWGDVVSKVVAVREAQDRAAIEERVVKNLQIYDSSPILAFEGKVIHGVAGVVSPSRKRLEEMVRGKNWFQPSLAVTWKIDIGDAIPLVLEIFVVQYYPGNGTRQEYVITVNGNRMKGRPWTMEKVLAKAEAMVEKAVQNVKSRIECERSIANRNLDGLKALRDGTGLDIVMKNRIGRGMGFEFIKPTGNSMAKGIFISCPDHTGHSKVEILGRLSARQIKEIAIIVVGNEEAEPEFCHDEEGE